MADTADIQRLIGDLAREGTVASVDLDAGTARVQFADDLTTGDIPWLASRAGSTRTWSPPAVGEQVLVLAPDAHQFSRQKRDDVPGVKATWHDRKFGKREQFVAGKVEGAKTLSRVYANEADAQAAANAANGRAGREPVSLNLTLALGRPGIHVEMKASVSGYKTPIDVATWLVVEVTHTFGDRGYSTGIKLEAAR